MVIPFNTTSDPPFESIVFTNASDSLTLLPRIGGPSSLIPAVRAELLVDASWYSTWQNAAIPNYTSGVVSTLGGFVVNELAIVMGRNGDAARLPSDRWRSAEWINVPETPHGMYVTGDPPPELSAGALPNIYLPLGLATPEVFVETVRYGDLSVPVVVTYPKIELRLRFETFDARNVVNSIVPYVSILQQPIIRKTVGLNVKRYDRVPGEFEFVFAGSTNEQEVVYESHWLFPAPSGPLMNNYSSFLNGSATIDIPCSVGPPPFSSANASPEFNAVGGVLRFSVPQP